jgi:phosphate-selective porin OprO and OprP
VLARHHLWQTLACVVFGIAFASDATAQTSSSEPSALVWTFDSYRPAVSTPDGRFSFVVRARFQLDGAFYDGDSPPAFTSAGLVRRAYLGFEGRAFRDFSYEYRMDFGGHRFGFSDPVVNLARVAYNFQDIAGPGSLFRINAGLIKTIFTYSDTVSSANLTFLERASVVNVASASYGGSTQRPGVELTFQKSGNFREGDNVLASAGFTGSKPEHGASHGTQLLGRFAFYWPWNESAGTQLGGSASEILDVGSDRIIVLGDFPEIRVGAEHLVSTGAIPANGGAAWGLESGSRFRNLYVGGEYYGFVVEREIGCAACSGGSRANFSGWYVETSWVMTGETKDYLPRSGNNSMATFGSPQVRKPFSLDGENWGAWEIAARYSDLDLNWHEGAAGTPCASAAAGCIRGGEQKIWTVALNWYLNDYIRLQLDYLKIDVDRLDALGVPSGRRFGVLGTRVQFTN